MPDHRPDPSGIMRLATGYWESATLLAANELGVFAMLADGPHSEAEIALRLGGGPRGVSMLLDACAGLGLLVKEEQQGVQIYANTISAQVFLVPGRPGYLGDALRWSADQYAAWGRLARSVRTDSPAVVPEKHLGDDPETTRTFVMGMHNRALGVARGVIHFLDMDGIGELLDVGGGPGTYSTLLVQKYPQMQATVLDLPGVVKIAAELIEQAGVSDQVRTIAGDATQDDYGDQQYDAVLFSGVLHQMSHGTIQKMFERARRALRPGGRVVVCDIMLDTAKTQPVFATLFSLQMLLTSAEGAVFSVAECITWLEKTGFTDVGAQNLPPPLPYTVVVGTRKEGV